MRKTPNAWKVAAFAAVFGIIAVSFSAADAAELSAPPVSGQGKEQLMDYVAGNATELYAKACKVKPAKCRSPKVNWMALPAGIWGATIFSSGEIVINPLASDELVQAIFVHEYVHYLQVLSGDFILKAKNGDACAVLGAELTAYTIGDGYASENGVEIPYGKVHPLEQHFTACIDFVR